MRPVKPTFLSGPLNVFNVVYILENTPPPPSWGGITAHVIWGKHEKGDEKKEKSEGIRRIDIRLRRN